MNIFIVLAAFAVADILELPIQDFCITTFSFHDWSRKCAIDKMQLYQALKARVHTIM
jgi:hypothetical protein